MITKPLVSIVVPVFNTDRYLYECLLSIYNQTYKNWECILLDDGSYDYSTLLIDEFCMYDTRFRKLTPNTTNQGISKSLNRLVRESKGEYFGQVDSDDRLHPTCLSETITYLEKTRADIIYTNFFCINEQNQFIGHGFSTKYDFDKYLMLDFCVVLHFKLISKQYFNLVGGFNESLYFAEDYDFLLKSAWGINQKHKRIRPAKVSHLRVPLYTKRTRRGQITQEYSPELQKCIVSEIKDEIKDNLNLFELLKYRLYKRYAKRL